MNLFISPVGEPFRGAPGLAYPSGTWFAAADTDHDGRLSRAEFQADAERYFRALDADHDGVVDGFEAAEYEKTLPEIHPLVGSLSSGEGQDLSLGRPNGEPLRLREDRPRRRKRNGPQPTGAGLFSHIGDPQPIAAADGNFDSKITLAELRAITDRRFDLLDLDKRGFLTQAVLPKTPIQVADEERLAEEARRKSQGKPVEGAAGRGRRDSPPQDR